MVPNNCKLWTVEPEELSCLVRALVPRPTLAEVVEGAGITSDAATTRSLLPGQGE